MAEWRNDPIVGAAAVVAEPARSPNNAAFVETPGGAVVARPPRRPQQAQPARGSFEEAWRNDLLAEPSAGAKIGAAARTAVGGFVESGATVAGTLGGGALGALGANPVSTAAGAALGAGLGNEVGRMGRRALDRTGLSATPESLPEALRPYGYAGEAIGGAGPMAAAPVMLAGQGFRSGGTFLDRLVEMAGRSPNAFLASEAAGAGGAAVGGAVSESYLPGNTGARVASEIAGGFFNPSRVVLGASRSAAEAVKNAIATMTPTGRENRAAKVLQDIVTQSGEDPAALAAALRASGLPGINVTGAQKTGSPALISLEAKLAQESAKFGADSRRMAEEGLSSLQNMIGALKGTGDPQALRAAAELQDRYFRTVVTGRIQMAEARAVEAAQRITRDTPQTRSLLARQANELLDEAMRDVRRVESELWEAVPKDVRATPESIVAAHKRIRNEMLPEETMPPVIEGFVQRMAKDGVTTSGELIRFRSRALALAREAAGQGKANDARIFGNLAEATLDDLDKLARPTMGSDMAGVPGELQPLADARAFSRQLHETFSRTFAGDAMASKATGADRIPPELMLRRAMGSGREMGEVRLRELEEAMRFLPSRGLGGPEAQQNLDFMLNAQERVLRLSAAEAIDPLTGRVSPTRVSRFLDSHAELLERFPEVRRTLQGAVQSEVGAQQVRAIAEGATRVVERQAAFAKVLRTDSASDAVRKAIGSDRPESEVTALARLAKGRGGGADAVEGFKAAVWDDAMRRSTDQAGNVSFEKLNNLLFTEMRPGLPPLANVLQREGVLNANEIAQARAFLKQAATIQSAMGKSSDLEKLMQNPDALFDLVIRTAGAKLGATMSAAGPGGSGGSLIAASRGSSFAKQVFDKVPQGKISEVLKQAAMDPKFAAMLLEKPTTPAEGIRLARQIHAYALQAGLLAPSEE